MCGLQEEQALATMTAPPSYVLELISNALQIRDGRAGIWGYLCA
jgi:hypothetical protein